jgi:two-component system sensor histidine kinase YesM
MKTIQRLWFFYTVFFLLPLIVWTVFYFFQLHENIMNKYRSYHKDIAISMAASYQDRILSIVNTAALFQQNRYFINYVEDWNQPMAERIFSFNIDINPLIGYIVTTNNLLQDLAVYSYRSARIPPYFFIRDWDKQFLPRTKLLPWDFMKPRGSLLFLMMGQLALSAMYLFSIMRTLPK